MISSAKHYLEFELEEPKIDAMVDVASEEGALGEEMTPEKSRKKGMPFKCMLKKEIKTKCRRCKLNDGEVFDALKAQGMSDKKAGPISTSVAMKKN
jgi:hypothetical protein